MNKGDIVLIPFPFTDLSGVKNRPALVLVDDNSDVTVCFLTTQLKYQSELDIKLEPSSANGLKRTSIIRLNKIATINNELVLGRLGNMTTPEIKVLNNHLIKLFKIDT
ncbi:type II toxin-antitoxin system PemK/MazF family toxin [Carboxylicivirga sp. N1Y90]|uniref:type II toxin-antitoxin system PemK/MazF family toxin n=1 Tax=Carboxylicivirga fragile TaxID=3417571 RepID=UPI003D354A54|nr:type II toxin-antitoxin system PemK/MazF family toxin [Marinilabiliaceae bacterium N1Y90]